jgi:hypothetical protein
MAQDAMASGRALRLLENFVEASRD